MDKLAIENLMNEIRVLGKMDHPNIVKIFEFYQDKAFFYIITEFLEGGELFDKITKITCFSEIDSAKIMK